MSFFSLLSGRDGPRGARPSRNVRRLSLEPLEDRSLLSVSLGPPPHVSMGAPPSLGAPVTWLASESTAAATHFSVIAPASIPADVSVPVQVVAMDAQNHPTSNYSGTANVTTSNTSDLFPSSVTFKNGSAVFQASFAAQGSDTLTVTDQTTSTLTGQATVSVTAPAVASQYAISILPPTAAASKTAQPLPPPAPMGTPTVPTGTAVTVQVLALDAQNQPVTNYSGTEAVTCSDTATGSTWPATVTFVNGVGTFQGTFATTGKQTITVTDTTNSITGTLTVNVTAPAVASQYAVSILPPAPPVQTSPGPTPQPQPPAAPIGTPTVATGTPVTVQVVAMSAQNQPVNTYSGTATVTCSDTATGAVWPTSVTFVNGVGTFQVTFATTGKQTITVTDTTNSITGTLNVNVVTPPTTGNPGNPPPGNPGNPPPGNPGNPPPGNPGNPPPGNPGNPPPPPPGSPGQGGQGPGGQAGGAGGGQGGTTTGGSTQGGSGQSTGGQGTSNAALAPSVKPSLGSKPASAVRK
jgi:hypothetical protein